MTKVLAESQIEIKQRQMRMGNIKIKLNAASGRKKIPYPPGKGNNRVGTVENDGKAKYVQNREDGAKE